MLRVARLLGENDPLLDVRTTLLGAHALPLNMLRDRAAYIRLVVDTMLPQVCRENLADAVDGFCETIAFSPEEIEQVLVRACDLGLDVKTARRSVIRPERRRPGCPLSCLIRRSPGIYLRSRR